MASENIDIILSLRDQASQALLKFEKNVKTTRDRLEDTAKSAQNLGYKMAAMGTAIVGAAGLTVKAASDLAESMNAVNVVFGDAADEVLQFGKTAAQSAGLSQKAFNDAVVPIGAQLQNLGFTADEAATSSINLAQRAADMASIFNTDVSDALTAIQAGLRGEADPLERFGVGLSAAAVEAYALSTGLVKTKGELDANTIAAARMGLLMEQTERYAGDFANTSDQFANSLRILKAQLTNVAAQLGSALLPILERAIQFVAPLVTKLAEWISNNQKLASAIVIAITAIGGIMLAIAPLLIALPSLVAGWGILGTVVGSFATGVGPAVLAVIGALTALVIVLWPHVKTLAQSLFEIASTVASYLLPVFQSLWGWFKDSIIPIFIELIAHVQSIAGAFIALLVPAFNWVWQTVQDLLLPALQGLWVEFKKLWEMISPIILPVLKLLASILGGVVIAGFLLLVATVKYAVIPVVSLFISILKMVIEWINNVIKAVGDVINWFKNLNTNVSNSVDQMGANVYNRFNEIYMNFMMWIENVKALMQQGLEAIKAIWNAVWQAHVALFQAVWGAIKSVAIGGFNLLKSTFNSGAAIIASVWSSTWDRVKGILGSAWDGIKSMVTSGVNWVIDKLNFFIRQYRKLQSAANVIPGVSLPNIPDIPYLANGGIVTKPTLAMIGEGGESEAVVPLSKARSMGFGGGAPTIVINNPYVLTPTDIVEQIGDPIIQVLKQHGAVV